jgi:sterol desaturase/sphingolipid hydroxylase (fatty acid hydroxylase superfamily)
MLDLWFVRHSDAVQAALFFSLFALLAVVERRSPARGTPPLGARWRANLALTALNVAVQSALPVSFFAAAVWASEQRVGVLHRIPLSVAAAAVVTLLGRAFVSFSTHWLMHKVPWFWRLHRVHHSDIEMDVSTTVRFHPLEFAVGLPLGLPVIVALGASPWAIALYELLDAAVNVLSHANVRLPPRLDVALRYVVVTPDLHRVHHSSHRPETDSNFGAVFPVWDLVFGTFRTETRAPLETMQLGLAELRDERTHRNGWLLASPFRAWPGPGEPALEDRVGTPQLARRNAAGADEACS